MLGDLRDVLKQQIVDWQDSCYGHTGIELGIKIRTL